jgi:hypothetical protein
VNRLDGVIGPIHREQLGHLDRPRQKALCDLLTAVRTGD